MWVFKVKSIKINYNSLLYQPHLRCSIATHWLVATALDSTDLFSSPQDVPLDITGLGSPVNQLSSLASLSLNGFSFVK